MIIAYRLSYFFENPSRTESIFLFENKKLEGIIRIEKNNPTHLSSVSQF